MGSNNGTGKVSAATITPDVSSVGEDFYVKFLTQDGTAPQAGAGADQWPLPTANADGTQVAGAWTKPVADPSLCYRGWHAATMRGVYSWLNERAFLALLAGVSGNDGTKVVGKQGQLVAELTEWATSAGRRRFILALFGLQRPAWERSGADLNLFDNFVGAYTAYSANPEGNGLRKAAQDAAAAIYDYSRGRGVNPFVPNSKMPIHGVISVTGSSVTAGSLFDAVVSVSTVKNLMASTGEALVLVAHQDHVNSKAGKWTSTLETEAGVAANTQIGELFVSTFNPGVKLPADFELRKMVRRLAATHTDLTRAAADIKFAEETIAAAQASIADAKALQARAREDQNNLSRAIMDQVGGDPAAALVVIASMR